MKSLISELVANALAALPELASTAADIAIETTVERSREQSHGDFACNVAMRLAKAAGKNPREIASAVVDALPANTVVEKTEIAGPGFINFYLSKGAFHDCIRRILDEGEAYGRHPQKERPRILLEFVSANPTGPLHVGHGRLAAYGATVGNLLEAAGYSVHREYYVNDAGRQMDILGLSTWLRHLETQGVSFPFPDAGYKGDYVRDIAAALDTDSIADMANIADVSESELNNGLPEDGSSGGDREAYVDALIEKARTMLGDGGFDRIRRQAMESIRTDIEDDLAEFGVHFDQWYSEQSLTSSNRIEEALDVLRSHDLLYEKDGATWFPTSRFGDEKDRVVIRENGLTTYFASDIAYHFDKRERGFDHLIDILGADHHGYVARVRAGLEAMGYEPEGLEVELVQFVALYRGGEKMQMSTRSGEFDTLRQLRAEVGNDAARFYYVMRSNDQHLDFDLDVAKAQTKDNPVYYVQYAHARIASVFATAGERDIDWDEANGRRQLALLEAPREKALMTALSRYPEVVELAAQNRAPQTLVFYLRDLSSEFHSWYNDNRFLKDTADLRDARLVLSMAVQIVLANGLEILGVSAPESM